MFQLYWFSDTLKILIETFAGFITCPCQYTFYLTTTPFVFLNCVDMLDAMVRLSTQFPSILDKGTVGLV